MDAAGVDYRQVALVLAASTQGETAKPATVELANLSFQPGYVVALATVLADETIHEVTRHAAGLALKNYLSPQNAAYDIDDVSINTAQDDTDERPPPMTQAERNDVFALLMPIRTTNSKHIRAVIALVIARVIVDALSQDDLLPQYQSTLIPALLDMITPIEHTTLTLLDSTVETLVHVYAVAEEPLYIDSLLRVIELTVKLVSDNNIFREILSREPNTADAAEIVLHITTNAYRICRGIIRLLDETSQPDTSRPTKCVACRKYPRTHRVFPCQHVALCTRCSGTTSECPICRTRIDKTENVEKFYHDMLRSIFSFAIPNFIGIFSRVIQAEVELPPLSHPHRGLVAFGSKCYAMDCISKLTSGFHTQSTRDVVYETLVYSYHPILMMDVVTSLAKTLPLYENASVYGSGDITLDDADDEQSDIGISAYVSALVEYIRGLTFINAMTPAIKAALPTIIPLVMRYMQMSQDEVNEHDADLESVLAYQQSASKDTTRFAMKSFLHHLIHSYKRTPSIIAATSQRFINESAEQARGSHADWWKLHESALLALQLSAAHLMLLDGWDSVSFIANVLCKDAADAATHPLVRTQAIIALARYLPAISKRSDKDMFIKNILAIMLAAINQRQVVALVAAGLRALYVAMSLIDKKSLEESIVAETMQTLCLLLSSSAGELTVHSVLQCLHSLVVADAALIIKYEPIISPALWALWNAHRNVDDVFNDIQFIVKELSQVPSVIHSMQQSSMNIVMLAIAQARPDPDIAVFVENCMGVVDILVHASLQLIVPLHPHYVTTLLPALIQMMLQSDENDVISTGVALLTSFIRACPPEQVDVGNVCNVAARLLSSHVAEVSAQGVGGLICQLIFRLSAQIGNETITNILRACVVRMYSALSPDLTSSIIRVFAKMTRVYEKNFIDFLSSIGNITVASQTVVRKKADGAKYAHDLEVIAGPDVQMNVLEFVIRKWTSSHNDIRPHSALRDSLTALCTLAALNDARIINVPCDGEPIVNQATERVTRSKTAELNEEPMKFRQIPFSAKVIALVADEHLAYLNHPNDVDDDNDLNGTDDDYGEEDDEFDDLVDDRALVADVMKRLQRDHKLAVVAGGGSVFAPSNGHGDIDEDALAAEFRSGKRNDFATDALYRRLNVGDGDDGDAAATSASAFQQTLIRFIDAFATHNVARLAEDFTQLDNKQRRTVADILQQYHPQLGAHLNAQINNGGYANGHGGRHSEGPATHRTVPRYRGAKRSV